MAFHTFEIPRRQRQCVVGGEEFAGGQPYYSLLESTSGQVERKDYCAACWREAHDLKQLKQKVFWKSSVPARVQVSEGVLRRDERALKLLKEYSGSSQIEELNQAFILALMLTRSKMLQLKQEVEEEGSVVQLFEVRQTEEMIGVKKIEASSIQPEAIQAALASQLSA